MADVESKIRNELERYDFRLVMLFGSTAVDRARGDSDVDLAVLADSPLDVETRMNIIGDIANITGRPVDLVDMAVAGLPVMGEALQGKRLIGSSETFVQVLSRYLVDAADFMPLRNRLLEERRAAWIA